MSSTSSDTISTSGDPAGDVMKNIVGGIAYGGCPLPGLATAGQPTAGELRALGDAGVKAVLDLRHPTEPRGFDEAATARAAGLRYENIPVTPATLHEDDFARVRAFLNEAANRPVLVHCASANRVGALLIPYLVLDAGHTIKAALQLAQGVGLRSPELAAAAEQYVRAQGAADPLSPSEA